jgi:hypothetical protein
MSTKEQFIVQLRQARAQHLKWLNNIKLMVTGISIDASKVPVNQSESAFGVWLYEKAMVFATANSKNVLAEIDSLHTLCYEHFLKIYHTLNSNRSGGLLQNVFGSKKASENELLLAQKYYEELVGASDNMINRIRLFESQMLATVESKFDELVLTSDEPSVHLNMTPPAAPASRVQRMYRGQPLD